LMNSAPSTTSATPYRCSGLTNSRYGPAYMRHPDGSGSPVTPPATQRPARIVTPLDWTGGQSGGRYVSPSRRRRRRSITSM
jgi:hypothetical protein